jgi:hypothetical protein
MYKRKRTSSDSDSDDADKGKAKLPRPVSAVDVSDLKARLLGVAEGASRVQVGPVDGPADKDHIPRDDGFVVQRRNANVIVQEEEGAYGPTWFAEELRREQILERDPQYRFLQLLAGAMATDVFRLYEPESVQNAQESARQFKTMFDREQARIMVPADEKLKQLKDLREQRDKMRSAMQTVERLVRDVQPLAALSAPLASMTGTSDTREPRGLPLVAYMRAQMHTVVVELAEAQASVEGGALDANLRTYLWGDNTTEAAIFNNPAADALRESMRGPVALLSLQTTQGREEMQAHAAFYLVFRNDVAAGMTRLPYLAFPPGSAVAKLQPRSSQEPSTHHLGLLVMGTVRDLLHAAESLYAKHALLWPPKAAAAGAETAVELARLLPSSSSSFGAADDQRRLLTATDRDQLSGWLAKVTGDNNVSLDVSVDSNGEALNWTTEIYPALEAANAELEQQQQQQGDWIPLRGLLDANALAAFVLAVTQCSDPDVGRSADFRTFYSRPAHREPAYAAMNLFFNDAIEALVKTEGGLQGLDANVVRLLTYYAPGTGGRGYDYTLSVSAPDDEGSVELTFTNVPGGVFDDLDGDDFRATMDRAPPALQQLVGLTHAESTRRFRSWLLTAVPPTLLYKLVFEQLLLQHVPAGLVAAGLARPGRAEMLGCVARSAQNWLTTFPDEERDDVQHLFRREHVFPQVWSSLLDVAFAAGVVLSGELVAVARHFLGTQMPPGVTLAREEETLFAQITGSVPAFYRPRVANLKQSWSARAYEFIWGRDPRDYSELAVLLNGLERLVPLPFAEVGHRVEGLYVHLDLVAQERDWLKAAGIPRPVADEVLPALVHQAVQLNLLASMQTEARTRAQRARYDGMADALSKGEQEYERLVKGLQGEVLESLALTRRLHRPPRTWMTRPEMTGHLRLNAEVVARLEEAMAVVRRDVPSLRGMTLRDVTEGRVPIASGLPGAFARLVAALVEQGRLSHPHQYNTQAQHRNAPARRQQAVNDLKQYRFDAATGAARGPGVAGYGAAPAAGPAGFYLA